MMYGSHVFAITFPIHPDESNKAVSAWVTVGHHRTRRNREREETRCIMIARREWRVKNSIIPSYVLTRTVNIYLTCARGSVALARTRLCVSMRNSSAEPHNISAYYERLGQLDIIIMPSCCNRVSNAVIIIMIITSMIIISRDPRQVRALISSDER